MDKKQLQEKVKKEVEEEINNFSAKYKGDFMYLSESEKVKLTNLLGEMFLAGFNYGINQVKHL